VLVELSVPFGPAALALEVHSSKSGACVSILVMLCLTDYLLHSEELVLLVVLPSSDADVTPASSSIWSKWEPMSR
jgi:hypothetical protein